MLDLDAREARGQIQIADSGTWYKSGEKLDPAALIDGLLKLEGEALSAGYAGLRTKGNCAWVASDQWSDFLDYETRVQGAMTGRRMTCMRSYCNEQLADGLDLDVLARHHLALPTAGLRLPVPNAGSVGARSAPADWERQKKNFDLAMTASRMGTWRYTVSDNICLYDDNAQALYGLDAPAFLHDEAGVREKFHPDDVALMWERIAAAFDPHGDGRYDVEYRVRQKDGSWR